MDKTENETPLGAGAKRREETMQKGAGPEITGYRQRMSEKRERGLENKE